MSFKKVVNEGATIGKIYNGVGGNNFMKDTRPFYKKKRFIVFALVVLGLIYVAYGVVSPGRYDDFASCLSEKGLTMYGAYWCPHCANQKALFGKSFSFVKYVECTQETELCGRMNVTGYPTWIVGDRRAQGEQSMRALAELAGCPAP